MRTFIAIELPSSLQTKLRSLQNHLTSALEQTGVADVVRWTAVESIHLTLRFLGDTTPLQSERIAAGLAPITQNQRPFELTLMTLGCFPDFRQPNVIWTGLGGQVERLAAMQEQIEFLAQRAGFTPESRRFSPHITLGRVRREAGVGKLRDVGSVVKTMTENPIVARWSAPLQVNQVVFMQSELRPSGAVYTPLAHCRLANAPGRGSL